MAVKYYDPTIIFGDDGDKMDTKNPDYKIPSKTLIAATPLSTGKYLDNGTPIFGNESTVLNESNNPIDVQNVPVKTPDINVPEVSIERTPVKTPEGILSTDNTAQRKYYNPDEIFSGTSETVKTEPNDAYEAAVMARPNGQTQDGTSDNLKDAEEKGLFTWNPELPSSAAGSKLNDASSRNYNLALQDQMASMGTNPSKVLKSAYSDAYNEAMAGHGKPVIPYKRTPDNMQKYQQDLADWQSRDAYGRSKAEKAVMDRKSKLTEDAAKWADNIAKENSKIIGKNGEMLFDPAKRDVANHILVNEITISAISSKLGKATTPSEIASQVPSVAYAASIARSPEVQPSQFSIEETKQIVDKLDPDGNADEKQKLLASARDYWILKAAGRAEGMPDPIEAYVQKLVYNKPLEIKRRLQEYVSEIKDMNNQSRASYIKNSTDMKLPPPEAVKPAGVSNKDFEDPTNPDKKGLIFNSLIRWNKMTSLTPEEVRLGIKDPNKTATGENEGVAAFQSYLKNKLNAQNYKVTGVPSKDDEAALDILLKQNPGMSAKDVITEGLKHQAEIDESKSSPIVPKKSARKGKLNTTYSTTKRNNAGILVGLNKNTGLWEVVR